MPIRINLKELFPSDAQDLTVDKINFNFNKLLELGIGELGPRGNSGIQGAAGPIGIVGPQGDRGSTWFVDSAADPNLLTFADLQAGDFYLDSQNFAVWQYNGTSWNFIFDLSAIINNYLTASPSPFVRGLGTGSPADDRFILFNRRGDTNDVGRGPSNISNNDVLFLNNFDENVAGYTSIPGLSSGNTGDDYTALLKIFDQSVTAVGGESGRYHLEMGTLYEVSANNYALTDIIESFKLNFKRTDHVTPIYGLDHHNVAVFSMDKTLNAGPLSRITNGLFEFRFPKVDAVTKEGGSVYVGSRYGIDQELLSPGVSLIDGVMFAGELGNNAAIGLAHLYDIPGIPNETGYISNVAAAQSYLMLDTLAGDMYGIYVNKKLLQDGGNIIQVGTTPPRVTIEPAGAFGSPFNLSSFIGFAGIASVGNQIYVVSGDSKLTSTPADLANKFGYINRYTIENPNNPVFDNFQSLKFSSLVNDTTSFTVQCAARDSYGFLSTNKPIGTGLSDIDIVGKYAYVTNTQITNDSAGTVGTVPRYDRTVFQIWELDSIRNKLYPKRVSRLGYQSSGIPGLPNNAYFYLNAAYRVKVKGKYAIVGTNALHGPSTARNYLGMPALTTPFDLEYYFGHLQVVDISNPTTPITLPLGAFPTPTTVGSTTNDITDGKLAQAIMDFEIVDDYVVALTWEQGIDSATYGGNFPTSVHVDIFNIAGFETAAPLITHRGRSDTPLLNTLPSVASYDQTIKFGAITANKKYIYAAHGKTVKVFALDRFTTTGTITAGCKYTYNQIASFTVPIAGEGTANYIGIYDIKQLGNSLYILAIEEKLTNASGVSGCAFKYDVSGGFGDPATSFGNTDGLGNTIPVWKKEFEDYQAATRLKIIGKHIYASAHGGNGGTSDVDAVQLLPLDFDGIYTAGAHIESLRMDQGYVMGNLEVGQNIAVSNSISVAGSVSIAGAISAGSGTTPVGSVIAFAGASAPSGWLICDGSNVSSTNYLKLHSVISNTYGGFSYTGESGIPFNLPDLRQRIPVGRDAATGFNPLGYTDGEKNHVLTKAEIPKHKHTVNTSLTDNGQISMGNALNNMYGLQNGNSPNTTGNSLWGYPYLEHSHSISGTTGDGTTDGLAGVAHNNMQPYIIMNYIIYTGI